MPTQKQKTLSIASTLTTIAKQKNLNKVPLKASVFLEQIKTKTTKNQIKQLSQLLKTKPQRTISGVSPLAIMSKYHPCPHGRCTFCPGGEYSRFKSPQSYTGHEPASMRAFRNDFDAFLQTFDRLHQYILNGHIPQKNEVIVMSGTFLSFPTDYQYNFIKDIYAACNTFGQLFYKNRQFNYPKFLAFFKIKNPYELDQIKKQDNASRVKLIKNKILKIKNKRKSLTLSQEQKINEKAKIRIIGLTIETKPDWCKPEHIRQALSFGCTRIELGVQNLNDDSLKFTNRGHTVQDVITATKALKDSALKVCYHIMPGLPKSNSKEDIKMFKTLFTNQSYKPDMLKIYPLAIIIDTPIYIQYKRGEIKPYSFNQIVNVISQGYKYIPNYCRVMRIQRDIPSNLIEDGSKMSNLRQAIEKKIQELKLRVKEIRFREIGRQKINLSKLKIIYKTTKYKASGGLEYFIEAKDKKTNALLGFLRLRIPDKPFLPVLKNSAFVRELHVYGESVPVGEKPTKNQLQHKGIGKILMKLAEKITKENKIKKIAVIAGVGVREYYKKLGYKLKQGFMLKNL